MSTCSHFFLLNSIKLIEQSNKKDHNKLLHITNRQKENRTMLLVQATSLCFKGSSSAPDLCQIPKSPKTSLGVTPEHWTVKPNTLLSKEKKQHFHNGVTRAPSKHVQLNLHICECHWIWDHCVNHAALPVRNDLKFEMTLIPLFGEKFREKTEKTE